MPHQNALFRTDMIIHAEIAVPVRDATIYATLPFQVLPKAGDKIWLYEDIDLIVDNVEFIFQDLKPPFITICCKRLNALEHDTHINLLNKFGFDVISAFTQHVELIPQTPLGTKLMSKHRTPWNREQWTELGTRMKKLRADAADILEFAQPTLHAKHTDLILKLLRQIDLVKTELENLALHKDLTPFQLSDLAIFFNYQTTQENKTND